MKNERHQKILEIIEKYEVDTQGALIDLLAKEGYFVTQTTASRDIRELRLIKVLADDVYKYATTSVETTGDFETRLKNVFSESAKRYLFRSKPTKLFFAKKIFLR